jgi:HEAT repeat protein
VAAATSDDLDPSGPPESRGEPRAGRPAPAPGTRPAPASPVDAALERFYLYFDEPVTVGSAMERWRKLADDLRGMGAAGTEALMRVLEAGTSSDERRAAARLLGELRAPEALALLQDVLDRDGDVLLRRDVASALRRIGTAEAAPYMESLVRDSREDRFVRLSAASGLAQLGKSEGVTGLVKIFEESERDGRWRDMAFRALRSRRDQRTLAFMRDLVTSDAEVAYRLQAIRFVKAQGDRQALSALERVMQSPTEQPSIREAAAQAHAAILSK